MSWENFQCKQIKKEKRHCHCAFMIHSLYNYTVGEDYARSYAYTAVVGRRVFPQKDCIQEVILRHHYIIVERFPLIMLIKRVHENHSMAWCFLWAHVVDGDVAVSSNEKKNNDVPSQGRGCCRGCCRRRGRRSSSWRGGEPTNTALFIILHTLLHKSVSFPFILSISIHTCWQGRYLGKFD